jgi:ubiquinone/menaquinone biosynthesis C-methylase UbiE
MFKSVFRRVKHIGKGILGRVAKENNTTSYWEKRVKQLGKRAVLDLRHSDSEYEEVTNRQKEEIYPFFIKSLKGNERILLDLGCGPGRFTADLAELIKGRAIGVDIVDDLLRIAPKCANVDFRKMSAGEIPLPDKSMDIVWICLVLGGLKPLQLNTTINEINRVLKPDGLLFFVENTSDKPDGTYWHFRQVQKYQSLFSFVQLKHLHDYSDLGETVSIMMGRKKTI